ncbi:twin-arginine translocation signal domain-containing protein [candidate division KSB1 bacterium]|nr:twin-arginine translocation signal domain-containing protein [candidate division KSB1 bacterium]
MPLHRRKFLGAASAATAGMLAGNNRSVYAQTTAKGSGAPGNLLRIGVLTCHPTHHHMSNLYGPIIQCVPRGDMTPTRMTGMVLTHIWDHDPKRVETFCAQFGTKPVKRYKDMVGEVDGIMLTDLRAADYYHLLSEPYLKAGIPVFFNRCFTPRVNRAKAVVELSKKYDTPILVPSEFEYTEPLYTLQEKVKEYGPKIKGVTGYNWSVEITHDVHGLWLLLAAVGGGVESVAVNRSVKSIFEKGTDTWTIKFKPRADNDTFYATLHNTSNFGTNASIRINFDRTVFEENIWGSGGTETVWQYMMVPPLLAFQRLIEGKPMEQTHEHIVEKTAAFIAGFKSHLELGGQPVQLSELDEDYCVYCDPEPTTYPDAMFD